MIKMIKEVFSDEELSQDELKGLLIIIKENKIKSKEEFVNFLEEETRKRIIDDSEFDDSTTL